MGERIKVAIDVGTTKICVLVAKQVGADFEVLGMGKYPSKGLEKGVVVDIAQATESIKKAVQEAEIVSGHKIDTASVGVSGSHINSLNSNGVVPINKSGKIKQLDIVNVLEAAKAVQIADGQQVLHVLPQYYSIDGQSGIHDPIGMHGIRLEAQVHIITGSVASVRNIVSCCEAVGVKITDVILEQLASAAAVLNSDERNLGVAVLDIGGGTADLAVYKNNSIIHTKVFPVAGNHFTHDIAIGLQTTMAEAERVKHSYGIADINYLGEDLEFDVKDVQDNYVQNFKKSYLSQIIQPRAEELVELVSDEIKTYNLNLFISTGLVITGGGALLSGLPKLASNILNMPVRLGTPRTELVLSETLDNPIYATGYGLLKQMFEGSNKSINLLDGPLAVKIFYRMKSWVSDLF